MEGGRQVADRWIFPNGKAYYDYAIKLFQQLDMTADEIMLGLSESSSNFLLKWKKWKRKSLRAI